MVVMVKNGYGSMNSDADYMDVDNTWIILVHERGEQKTTVVIRFSNG